MGVLAPVRGRPSTGASGRRDRKDAGRRYSVRTAGGGCREPVRIASFAQRETKGGACAGLRFHPNVSSVAIHNLVANGQSGSRALVFVIRVQALKQAEDAAAVFGGDADSVIAHAKDRRPVLIAGEDVDFWWSSRPPEFQRVVDELLKELHQAGGICANRRQP